MLVLSRKLGQRIVIGSQIELVVTEIRGNQVRLGLVAPRDVPIHRGELHQRIIAEETRDTADKERVIAAPRAGAF